MATDRGLYVPESVPQITMGQLEKVGDSSHVIVTRHVLAAVYPTETS